MSEGTPPPSRLRRLPGDVALREFRTGGSPHVIALPASGAHSMSFAGLSAELPASWDVSVVELPGHGAAPGKPITTVPAMADRLAFALGDQVRGEVILVGHSLGGLVAYELANRMRSIGAGLAMIALVNTPPPHRARQLPRPAGTDDEFIRQLDVIGSFPAELRSRPAFLAPYLSLLRVDLTAVRNYRPGGHVEHNVPVVVYGAPDDPWVPVEWLREWNDYYPEALVAQVGSSHFAAQATPREVADQLTRDAAVMISHSAGNRGAGNSSAGNSEVRSS